MLCVYQSDPGGNKKKGSFTLHVGVASWAMNIPIALYKAVVLLDQKHSVATYGLSSNEASSLKSAFCFRLVNVKEWEW